MKRLKVLALSGLLGFGLPAILDGRLENSAYAATKLGDLSKFKKIAADTNDLVKKGDLVGAKARIKDLETIWDDAESGIKPRAGADWRQLDKVIDKALDALRDSKPTQDACQAAMAHLMETFSRLEK